MYAQAEALRPGHTSTLETRAFDVLHVASAAALGVKDFFTFDARQKALALKAGMKVKPHDKQVAKGRPDHRVISA